MERLTVSGTTQRYLNTGGSQNKQVNKQKNFIFYPQKFPFNCSEELFFFLSLFFCFVLTLLRNIDKYDCIPHDNLIYIVE